MSAYLPYADGAGDFAAERIICIGRNYAEHAREMGHDPEHSQPFFFFKPTSALLPPGQNFVYPDYSHEVHHELELVIALGGGGRQLTPDAAQALISGFAVGLDMTCRDIQREAKSQGRPWALAKGFDGSAPCSTLVRGDFSALNETGTLTLDRNGRRVQEGQWRDMIWPIPELLAEISRFIALAPGDLVFTGTPAGVGPVEPGDRLDAKLDKLCQLSVEVIPG